MARLRKVTDAVKLWWQRLVFFTNRDRGLKSANANVVERESTTDTLGVLADQQAQTTAATDTDVGSESEHVSAEQAEESARRQRIASIAKHPRWKRRLENWSPIVAVLTLVVLGFQSCILYQQTEVMDSQTVAMNTQTGVMQTGLNVSKQSLHAFRVSERAYVGVASLKANLDAAEIVITLHNIGSVPAPGITVKGQAFKVTPATGLGTTGSGEAVNESHHGIEFRWDSGEVQLFPGTPMPVVLQMPSFTKDEVDAILTRKQILYVGGTIEYGDGFKNRDSTTFAFKYNPPPTDSWTAHSDLSKFFKQQ